jgi:PKD repeat protein
MKTRISALLNIVLLLSVLSCTREKQEPLEAAFEANVKTTVAGGTITFADRSSGRPSKWKWTFEGGEPATSNLSGPTVTYALPGTYAVTLEVTNAHGAAVVKQESFITVSYSTVVADFEADRTTAVQGESIAFTDKSTGLPTTWLWEFIPQSGSPLTSREQNPTIKFDQHGSYTVKLTASNPEHSHQVSRTSYLTVLDMTSVEAAFTSDATATYAGGSITFADASVGNAQDVRWTFEGGSPATSSDRNPLVLYSTPGRYKVTLVASNPNKSSTTEKVHYILVVPAGGLQAFFPFDSHGSDVGPSRLAATPSGNVEFTGADRKTTHSKTAVFDGASYLNVADHAALNLETDNFTISCWVKTDRTNRMMIWQESGAKGSKDNQAWLRINDNQTTQYLRFATEDAVGGNIISLGSVARVNDGAWHHVVCVREGTNTKVYVDGVKMATEQNAAAVRDVSNESGFKIGAQEGLTAYSNFFFGQLDELIIYKRALTAAEVLDLFNL